jgi:hypothetical protein
MLRAGLSLGRNINTDARTITNITLNGEYAGLREYFGWSYSEFLSCNRAALDAALLDEPTRKRLTAKLTAA